MEPIPHKLVRLLGEAVTRAQDAGALPQASLPEITIERPHDADHGDYASSLPLKLGPQRADEPGGDRPAPGRPHEPLR